MAFCTSVWKEIFVKKVPNSACPSERNRSHFYERSLFSMGPYRS